MIEKYLKIVQTMMSFVIVPVIENLLNQLNKNEQQYSHKLVKSQLSFAKEKYEKYYLRLSYLVPCLILLIFLSNYGLLIMLIQYSIGYELLFYCISIILMGIVAYTTRRKVYVKVILDKYSGFSWWIVAVNMVIYLTSYIFMDVRLKIDFTELIVPNSDILATLYSAICLMIAVLVYLACLQRRLMRLRVHRTNCRIEIKKGSEEPEIIEGNRIIDCKEYSESIVLTYRDSITSEFFQKQSINKDSICIKNEYTDWDCFEFWRELKAPLTEELFSKYLRKKYKIHCVGFLNKDAKKYQYNIALQTSGLLKNEQMIPPIAIAGGLLDIFSESIAEEEIYEIFGRRVLDLISEYNKARNYDKILGSELYEELVVLRCARYTAELIQYFEDKVKDNEIEQNLMLKNEEYKEVFQKIERSEIYKRWESQWTLLNERQSC